MFEGWDNYFLMLGGAAGSLIGLLFVVVTLTGNVERSRALRGSAIYLTPTMVHFAVALTASAVAEAPRIDPHVAALVLAGAALAGLGNAIRTCFGIGELSHGGDPPHWSDVWMYGGTPAAIYVALLIDAGTMWAARPFAVGALAVLVMVLLLVAIRNAWDLITWMAPGRDTPSSGPPPVGPRPSARG
ncbi:MAG TPA: hypothetical protein VGG29_03650 [Caulobacteraceae bacterium]